MWRHPRVRRGLVALVGVCLAVVSLSTFGVPARAGALSPAGEAADRAVAWLVTQQLPDGGFELAAYPGFETPDAVLAIAMAAQTSQVRACHGRSRMRCPATVMLLGCSLTAVARSPDVACGTRWSRPRRRGGGHRCRGKSVRDRR